MTSKKIDAPDAQTFASVMGQAAWLMTMSKEHRDQPIRMLEASVAPAVLFRQFKLYSKDKQPVAFLTWASVSDAVKVRLEGGDKTMAAEDWRSGPHLVVVDCVSPFNPASVFVDEFMKKVIDAS